MNQPKIYFVHLGKKVPTYAACNASNAASNSGLNVSFLTDAPNFETNDDNIENHDLSWYDPSDFDVFQKKTKLDATFRDGFWLATAERFFVLHQAMKYFNLINIIHAENDVHLFDIEKIPKRLDELGKGIFLPQPYRDCIIPSFLYCNEKDVLLSLTEFIKDSGGSKNETQLLYDFSQQNPHSIFFLPTDISVAESSMLDTNCKLLTIEDVGGVFDANAIGQWLLGIDPRNHHGIGKNHFHNANAKHLLSDFNFLLSKDKKQLFLNYKNRSISVFCIHIHSKVNCRLSQNDYLDGIINQSNIGVQSVIHKDPIPLLANKILPGRIKQRIRISHFSWL